MKVAVLYDSMFGNTKRLAEFLAEKLGSSGHEVKTFRTTETKPTDLLVFEPEAIIVGAPTHAWNPARTLGRYIKKMRKLFKKGKSPAVKKAAAFNCNNGTDVCHKIEKKIAKAFPDIEMYNESLPIHTGNQRGEHWEENWEEKSNKFITGFLNFLS